MTAPPTAAACFVVSAFLSACVALDAGPPPLRTPRIAVEARPHAGTALTGPLPTATAVEEFAPLGVRQSGWWVEHAPTGLAADLASSSALVLGPGDADPLRPVARRAGSVGLVRGEAARDLARQVAAGDLGRATAAWDELAGLAPGSTLRLRVSSPDPGAAPELVLDAERLSSALEARVAVQIGLRADSDRETVLVAEPLRPDAGPIALVFDRAAGRDEAAALVAFVEIAHEAAVPPLRENVTESAARAADRRRGITRSEAERREIADLLSDLDDADERRARLVFLAGLCDAPLALDVALVATDDDLAAFAESVGAALPEPADRAGSAWPVERAAWSFLGRKAAEGPIAPELSGVLARQGGEAARFPGAIDDLLRGVASVEALAERLVEENLILLEDASPSARARAFDWLAARGEAPAGFDPFAPLADRRAALRRAEDARSQDGSGSPR